MLESSAVTATEGSIMFSLLNISKV